MLKTGYYIRFGRKSVKYIKGGAYDKTGFALHGLPHFLFVFRDLLVMTGFQIVELVYLALQDRQRLAECLKICNASLKITMCMLGYRVRDLLRPFRCMLSRSVCRIALLFSRSTFSYEFERSCRACE